MRPFTVLDMPQRSPEWFAARCGRLTGSCAGEMLSKIQKGEAAARRDLRLRLAVERLTGQSQDSDGFQSLEMKRGIEREGEACVAYEGRTGRVVRRTGFLSHAFLLTGTSLDGHVGDFEGVVEIKVPKSATHFRYWRSGGVPSEHLPQLTHGLWITGAEWADFVSWDDRFPPELQLYRARLLRANVDLVAYELAVTLFLSEVEKELATVQQLIETVAA